MQNSQHSSTEVETFRYINKKPYFDEFDAS